MHFLFVPWLFPMLPRDVERGTGNRAFAVTQSATVNICTVRYAQRDVKTNEKSRALRQLHHSLAVICAQITREKKHKNSTTTKSTRKNAFPHLIFASRQKIRRVVGESITEVGERALMYRCCFRVNREQEVRGDRIYLEYCTSK